MKTRGVVSVVRSIVSLMLLAACIAPVSPAQQTTAAVPTLVNFSGRLSDSSGKSLTGIVGVTFYLYNSQQGGAALWMETQNVQPDKFGNYTVQLGSTTSQGLPSTLFVSGEARWLGVQAQGQAEQPRVMLLSVPYAMKAGDAATVGGLPPSAFVLAAPGGTSVSSTTSSTNNTTAGSNVGGSGTQNYIPIWTDNTGDLGNSILYQIGTGSATKVGINEKNPLLTLDVNGGELVRGLFEMSAINYATKTTGYNSNPLNLESSAFNSGTNKYTLNHFQWQAEPTGNNTTTPGATLNLLYGTDPSKPTETGLNIASNGQITFATGQTFPGTGNGTITGVTAGTALLGGGNSGNVTLNVDTTKVVTGVVAGTDLTGGGTGGVQTLNLDTTKVPTLSAANTFTNNQTVNGNLTDNGNISATGAITGQTGVFNANSTTPAVNITQSGAGDTLDVAPAIGGTGVYAVSNSGFALFGADVGSGWGVTGSSSSGYGVIGVGLTGVYGASAICCSAPGGLFYGYTAPSGSGNSGSNGINGFGGAGDIGLFLAGGDGVAGTGGNGVFPGEGGYFVGGNSTATTGPGGDGILSFGGAGAGGDGNGDAGYFGGDLEVTGAISAGTKDFKIDHPLDPANKYLVHASVESSEMTDIYTGNVTTDSQGFATVHLPEWFEALNTDFRYQLTVIGQFAQAIISHEIENRQFEIRTNAPNVKVSWQVTGVRQDAYAKAHPLVVEEEKDAVTRSFYIHPELYGAPQEKGIAWARHPDMMKRLKQRSQQPPISTAALAARARQFGSKQVTKK